MGKCHKYDTLVLLHCYRKVSQLTFGQWQYFWPQLTPHNESYGHRRAGKPHYHKFILSTLALRFILMSVRFHWSDKQYTFQFQEQNSENLSFWMVYATVHHFFEGYTISKPLLCSFPLQCVFYIVIFYLFTTHSQLVMKLVRSFYHYNIFLSLQKRLWWFRSLDTNYM